MDKQATAACSQLIEQASGDEDKLQLLTWLELDVVCEGSPQMASV